MRSLSRNGVPFDNIFVKKNAKSQPVSTNILSKGNLGQFEIEQNQVQTRARLQWPGLGPSQKTETFGACPAELRIKAKGQILFFGIASRGVLSREQAIERELICDLSVFVARLHR